jgi:hypothetical protein
MNKKQFKKKRNESLQILEKFKKLRVELNSSSCPKKIEPKLETLLPFSSLDISQYDTKYVTTIFKHINQYPCFIPKYHDTNFSLTNPLYHEERAKQTHEWLTKIGTPKYLDIIEEVSINAKRLAQLAQGTHPLISDVGDIPHPIRIVEQERQKKCCPLIHYRVLGNGLYVLVNVNDMIRYSFDFNPLNI